MPNGGYRTRTEAGIFKGWARRLACPLALHQGRLHGLEFKRTGGRLTPDQITVHEAMRAAGAVVGVAYGMDQALITWPPGGAAMTETDGHRARIFHRKGSNHRG